jgi:hypothetical protein
MPKTLAKRSERLTHAGHEARPAEKRKVPVLAARPERPVRDAEAGAAEVVTATPRDRPE